MGSDSMHEIMKSCLNKTNAELSSSYIVIIASLLQMSNMLLTYIDFPLPLLCCRSESQHGHHCPQL